MIVFTGPGNHGRGGMDNITQAPGDGLRVVIQGDRSFDDLADSINIATFALQHLEINRETLQDEKYKFIFSVEEVNKKVLQGTPFRDAYKKVGEEIQQNKFKPDKKLAHTHLGSIGNLCNDKIEQKFNTVIKSFNKDKIFQAENNLLK